MVNIETVETRKGPRGRPLLAEPMNSERVLKVVYMREYENKRWRQIAEELSLSRQAPFLLHKKWQRWALAFIYNEGIDFKRKDVLTGINAEGTEEYASKLFILYKKEE